MTDNATHLSEPELAELIASASKELERRHGSKKREGFVQIKQLAAAIGVQVGITDAGKKPSRVGTKVAVKYRDPANARHAWAGHGMKPSWLRELLEQCRTLEEFLV